ncbi:MAG: tetratricopeptide repeat protein [Ferruginibacter sp.]
MDRVEQIKAYLKDNPNDSFLKHALALEQIKRGDDATARTLFTEILTHEPGYVGSYYHLGKLLERNNEKEAALEIYHKGMQTAKLAKDQHAYNELQGAAEDLED